VISTSSWIHTARSWTVLGSATATLAMTGCSPSTHGPSGPMDATSSSGYSVTAVHASNSGSITVDPGLHTAYLEYNADNVIGMVDTTTHAVSDTPIGSHINELAQDPDGRTLYGVGNSIVVFDTRTRSVTATIAVPKPDADTDGPAAGLGIDPTLHLAIVPFTAAGQAAIIDLAAGRFLGMIDDGGGIRGGEVRGGSDTVAVDPQTHRAYIAATNTVTVVDLSSEPTPTDIGGIPMLIASPKTIAFDPATHSLIVVGTPQSASDKDDLLIVDPDTRLVTATIPVVSGTEDVAVDSITHTAYVTSQVGDISVIDLAHRTVSAVLHVGGSPFAVAVDQASHTAYATDYATGDLHIVNHQ
jgi:YVTN family beta-propeller protein